MEVNQNNSNTEQVKETTMEQANIEKDKAKTDTKKNQKKKDKNLHCPFVYSSCCYCGVYHL